MNRLPGNAVTCRLILAAAAVCCAAAQELVSIPPGRMEVLDSVTGLKVAVAVSGFQIGKTEVTQRQFQELMGFNPSRHAGPDLPVENLTWWDAIRYCNHRSRKEGLEPCYDLATGVCDRTRSGYRLPTDAEWTLAAGSAKPAGNLREAGGHTDASILAAAMQRGTRPAGSFPPNGNGLHDMFGNVWEWCNDRYSSELLLSSVVDPVGPATGADRVIRGGSFLTTASQWTKGFRSSRSPDAASPFTGFRIARNSGRPAGIDTSGPTIIPAGGLSGPLSPLLAPGTGSAGQWRPQADRIRRAWMDVLGKPEIPAPGPVTRLVDTVSDPVYAGQLLELQVEPDYWERILVMYPHGRAAAPRPVVIVPFYDVDAAAGRNLGGRRFSPPGVRSFAYLAVQRGFIAVAVRWWGESYGEGYDEAVAALALRHPRCTGMGKWIWDAQRVLDYVRTLPGADAARIGMIGHSLGGKMALYAAAFEPRIAAVVASEPGIGLSFSNYDSFWYLGENIRKLPAGADQHQLLALIAPRPFLLIAGGDSDGDKSIPYLNAAREVYALYGVPEAIGFYNHRKGHTPSPEAVSVALDFLVRALMPR